MKNKFLFRTVALAIGYLIFADILCLFIDLTLAVFGSSVFKLISTFCTSVIFVGLIGNFAWSVNQKIILNERRTGECMSNFFPFIIGIILSAPYWIMWIILLISRNGKFSFYRVYKLLNGQFLQIFNLMEEGTDINLVNNSQMFIMLILTFVPLLSFIIVYFYSKRKKSE
ncbi:MAG: hypothetical protein ACI4I9_10220 [Porcipelethomonas sp.]